MYSVRITELEKEFKNGRKIFSGLNLELEESSLTALVGASGEGKTTLLNVIGLLDTDYSGQVELFGQKVNELNQTEMARLRNQQIGFILQEPLLIKNMSVRDNILLPTVYLDKSLRKSKDYYLARAAQFADQLGISQILDQRPATLSGGQKQRVTAIRALINDPQLILADEPTGSLDEENAKIIMDLLKKLSREGKTVFTVTHDSHIASQHDKVLQLKNGNITVKEN
ncbi:ABC transporter ATP-binding protein [Lactobacillus delbrueckii]|uniref:ABC transporter ATP-binding protein n=1 Tax=Lactobacillus delbrueckii TaxID=1584 RepID=UPI000682CF78|nr:ABC transporter ATP-binding protein [Lactobacillus delbrueckii]ALT48132.1 ABC transporter ATP-binding protein [Lactobacillus delbrueckii subsp. bulgaricus]APP03473.1 ABC transporter ATP-binding protein [Lactobacillus delbrueckii subsp. indicus]AQR54440.1 ABC transporter ATP-binding protein [Lactobacillus delbrueckii subsp. bulgaricus]AXI15651.1 ABC transporter ATP-binding protein [Lactobacillus delbrueckii subsp. bulgaricus]KNE30103.1 ABC transporter ATP-binding protein [Lactobacillus delbr